MSKGGKTAAERFLDSHGVAFEEHPYDYTGKGPVAKEAASALGADEAEVFKTLVFENDAGPLIAVVDAAHRVAVKRIAEAASAGKVRECAPRDAERHTGYQVGGISPFGTRKALPVFLDESALGFERIFINGGRRGLLVRLDPRELVRVLEPTVGDWRTD